MGVVAPYLPEVRAGGPMEDVKCVTFGEHLGPVAIYGDPVVGAHVVAQLIRVEIRGPGSYEVIGGHVARRATSERGEVGIDLVGEIASALSQSFASTALSISSTIRVISFRSKRCCADTSACRLNTLSYSLCLYSYGLRYFTWSTE